ncbi:DUF979 domain-containing protein [Gallaecimonas kandeliae]|uniref:DUF979 domain-containing protein n=1 Tax=Gallaecimonas kandeliae TaxID=3029055 RepID=UPI00264853B5|nr:DUF979 domain-containing protein [Gallaecimonas kandeliae]WKE64276.1 DUF979 domain-containing protein [Gallaecimonas kandeliae]
MLSIEFFYGLAGVLLLANGVLTALDRAHPRRWPTALFWSLYGLLFLVGGWLPAKLSGALVLAMGLLGGLNLVKSRLQGELDQARRDQGAERLGAKLFWPALAIPGITLVGALGFPWLAGQGLVWVAPKSATLISLGLACLIAFALACRLTRESPLQGLKENARLMDAIGWALLLPQMLATLGILFAHAGIGNAVAALVGQVLPEGVRFWAIVAYAVGMALFTMIMGNAFAAFPVITAGVGIPFLVNQYHGDAAVMAAIGMFSGYCGTLLTPMAANFNMVPAALLELDDRNAVIKAQVPTALLLLTANIALLWWLL